MTIDDALYVFRRCRQQDRVDIAALRGIEDMDEIAVDRFSAPGVAFTAHRRGKLPAMVGGVEIRRDGIGSLWLAGTHDWREVILDATRFARREVFPHCFTSGLRRVQALVRADWPGAVEYAERVMGMTREGLLRAIGRDGADYFMFATVRSS